MPAILPLLASFLNVIRENCIQWPSYHAKWLPQRSIMRYTTKKCWPSCNASSNGGIILRELNTLLRFIQIIKTWNTLHLQSNSIIVKHVRLRSWVLLILWLFTGRVCWTERWMLCLNIQSTILEREVATAIYNLYKTSLGQVSFSLAIMMIHALFTSLPCP